MNANLFALMREHFPQHADAPFLVLRNGRRFSYGAIDSLSSRFSQVLKNCGAIPGDRIAVQVEKSAEAVALYLACVRGGFVYLPLNTAYRGDELDYFLADAEPAVAIGDPRATEFASIAQHRSVSSFLTLGADGSGTLVEHSSTIKAQPSIVTSTADDLAAILYSSGTTGKPKGVMLSHGNLASNALTLHKLWQFRPDDVLLHALPLFHTHGLIVGLNTTLLNGSSILFHEKFSADDVMADLPRVTLMMGVPTYYMRLLMNQSFGREACRTMRLFISGSAPLLEETFNEFQRRTGHSILERYGMTEAGMITSAHPDKPRRANTVGWPLPDVQLRIESATQEIQIKGPNVFKSYWRKPEKTKEDFTPDGFFKTGDLARVENDGMISIIGRAKDMMICGGFNVYPKEIESLIDAMPGVDESAVVGMPHPDFGEAGLAVVTLKPDTAAIEPRAALALLKEKLANYKVPKMIVIAPSLPRNAMGKVQKNELRLLYRQAWDQHIKTDA